MNKRTQTSREEKYNRRYQKHTPNVFKNRLDTAEKSLMNLQTEKSKKKKYEF